MQDKNKQQPGRGRPPKKVICMWCQLPFSAREHKKHWRGCRRDFVKKMDEVVRQTYKTIVNETKPTKPKRQ